MITKDELSNALVSLLGRHGKTHYHGFFGASYELHTMNIQLVVKELYDIICAQLALEGNKPPPSGISKYEAMRLMLELDRKNLSSQDKLERLWEKLGLA